jgi:hypothetical protein
MAPTEAFQRPTTAYVRGAVLGLAAVSIWAGNIVVAGLGLRSSLTPWDISAIRFAVAGLVLLPYLARRGLALDRLGWIGVAALVLGGVPTVLLANAGLLFAPASHAGALFPGVMPLMVTLLAAAFLKEAFTPQKQAGFALIATGVVAMVWGGGGTFGTEQNIGHLLFLGSALAFACYTVAMRRARLDALHAAAISAVASMLIYIPLCSRRGSRRLRGAAGRDSAAGACSGSPDGGHLLCHLRSRNRHSRRVQRRGVRRLLPGHDRTDGHSHPRGVALADRLDRDRHHIGRRVRHQRRPPAETQ